MVGLNRVRRSWCNCRRLWQREIRWRSCVPWPQNVGDMNNRVAVIGNMNYWVEIIGGVRQRGQLSGDHGRSSGDMFILE